MRYSNEIEEEEDDDQEDDENEANFNKPLNSLTPHTDFYYATKIVQLAKITKY